MPFTAPLHRALLAAFALVASAPALAATPTPAPFTVKIIGFNDFHGNL